jgi:hypothetical protein
MKAAKSEVQLVVMTVRGRWVPVFVLAFHAGRLLLV